MKLHTSRTRTSFRSRFSALASAAILTLALAVPAALPAAAALDGDTNPTARPAASILFFQDGHDIAPVRQGTKAEPEFHGGIARLATVLAEQKAAGTPADVVFGGDLGGGTLFGALFHGSAMVEAFNLLGVNVTGFGQHDFDYGLGTLRENIANSSFPWVSSNLSAGGKPINGEENVAIIRQVGDVKIGYLGLTLGMETTSAGKDVDQADYVAAAKAAVKKLEGADVVVALAQFPLAADATRLLTEVPQIDVVLREENSFAQEGNDVTTLPDGRFAVAPEGNYGSLARINFIKNTDGTWRATHQEVQINATVAEDPAILPLQQKYIDELEKRLAKQVACSDQAYTRPQPLGALAAEAFRNAADAQIGWLNAGGMRADLAGGPLAMKDILAVFPYSNQVMKVEVTGAQLRLGLEQGADSAPAGNSGGYPILAGASFSYDAGGGPGATVTDLKLADGTPISDSDVLTLALTNYVVNGGNNVTAFSSAKVLVDAGFAGSDFDALVAELAKTANCEAPGTGETPGTDTPSSPDADETPAPGTGSSPATGSNGTGDGTGDGSGNGHGDGSGNGTGNGTAKAPSSASRFDGPASTADGTAGRTSRLENTGADVATLGLGGALAIAVGTCLVLSARRVVRRQG
ncbi:MAG: 5'-nucleotidase C-terminal domain-containing protein [Trueperella sp.]|uniref:bifunctional metallophosphatase/5'-nucleotidase n=1 Tax=Trueperella sp. TaxID=2699835 RepID=UPI002A91B6DB|nr:5'-nucleotidase C-terminal domain-containing protein [Trueperella sp.]MDY5402890.1 5'-nucleotidase C-terminal domain-containing protein [Trueperella sp.]